MFRKEFIDRISANCALTIVNTDEINRSVIEIEDISNELGKQTFVWTFTSHWNNGNSSDPVNCLESLMSLPEDSVYIIVMPQQFFRLPITLQMILDLIPHAKSNKKNIVMVGTDITLPGELNSIATILDFDLPTEQEHFNMIKELFEFNQATMFTEKHMTDMAKELCGLGEEAAEDALSIALFSTKEERKDLEIDSAVQKIVRSIQKEKAQTIKKDGLLEIYQPDERYSKIGGLDRLKLWAYEARPTFSDEARLFNIEPPGGILLLGAPGTGKSLAAKWLSYFLWQQLLWADFGKIYGKYVGESEARLRRMFKQVEAMKRGILFIDEIEKGLASGSGDSGVSSRILGTTLQWLQEKREKPDQQTLVVATANRIADLPPELLRPGRFDVIFYVDLPQANERKEIIEIHLAKRNQSKEEFDIESLVGASNGFTGAEIEEGVRRAMRRAFGKSRAMNTDDILNCFDDIVPMSYTRADELRAMRETWQKIGVPASTIIKEVSLEQHHQEFKKQLRSW